MKLELSTTAKSKICNIWKKEEKRLTNYVNKSVLCLIKFSLKLELYNFSPFLINFIKTDNTYIINTTQIIKHARQSYAEKKTNNSWIFISYFFKSLKFWKVLINGVFALHSIFVVSRKERFPWKNLT